MKIKLEKFEGPLDLLLQLIEKQKLEITDISLSEVTYQFLDTVEKMEESDPEKVSDFLLVAAKLLYMKSRAVLPFLQEDDEDEVDLTEQLRMYKEFVKASEKIRKMIQKKNFSYAKEKPLIKVEIEFAPPQNAGLAQLKSSFQRLIDKLKPLVILPQQPMIKTISLSETMSRWKKMIKSGRKLSFHEMVRSAKSKNEVIVNFLAILELVRQRDIRLKQTSIFDSIMVEKAK